MKHITGCLRTKEAAEYLGLSPQTLCNYRTLDRKAVALGEPMRGPRFLMICGGNVCVYRKHDLDAWLDTAAKATAKRFASNGAGVRR